jgi:3',5'-cyclic AMP phosphodiesterase CpdA
VGRFRYLCLLLWLVVAGQLAGQGTAPLRFVIIGDRTGEPQPGVYEQIWRELAAEKPAFVLSVGDTIQGLYDNNAVREWQEVQRLLAPYHSIPLYLTPGNHDIWSPLSKALFQKFSTHEPQYSFDVGTLHITVLDNSRSDELGSDQLQFLERDLAAHSRQPIKIVVSHRPSWLFPVLFRNPNFPLHQIAKRYGVRYVIAGHVHQMLHFELDGITYLSVPSAGGHLRASKQYEDGWFFAHTLVETESTELQFRIEEAKAPTGQGRKTTPADWGAAGLVRNGR